MGDVVEVDSGSIMPVDAIVLRAEQLYADESLITGETREMEKIGCS